MELHVLPLYSTSAARGSTVCLPVPCLALCGWTGRLGRPACGHTGMEQAPSLCPVSVREGGGGGGGGGGRGRRGREGERERERRGEGERSAYRN